MSAIRSAFVERPRVALLWAVTLLFVLIVAYLILQGLAGGNDEETTSLRNDVAAGETALARAQDELAKEQAQADKLDSKLAARDRRVRALTRKVDKLDRKLAASEAAASGPRRR